MCCTVSLMVTLWSKPAHFSFSRLIFTLTLTILLTIFLTPATTVCLLWGSGVFGPFQLLLQFTDCLLRGHRRIGLLIYWFVAKRLAEFLMKPGGGDGSCMLGLQNWYLTLLYCWGFDRGFQYVVIYYSSVVSVFIVSFHLKMLLTGFGLTFIPAQIFSFA